ncbi:kanamycin nucleotidyltransferase [Lysobacter enzymogenes]|uniref:kanamycin nucleotidyltransferase C-terminal domain-containing protein n=1 Tax=Lysobacter enzymogenes TaxID=69 RepID=UPI0033929AAB
MEYELPIGRLDDVFSGPRAVSADERNALYALIIESMRERFGEHLQHLVLYGSTARGEARPYSDIDLWGVIDDEVYGAKFQKPVEWVYGPGKALVYLLSRSAAEALAREVDESWPISRGKFVYSHVVWASPGNENLLARLREVATHPDPDMVERAMARIVSGTLYELIGKLRNRSAPHAMIAGTFAMHLALVTGLAARYPYATFGTVLEEAARLPAPDGAKELYALVIKGDLSDLALVNDVVERAWAGLASWQAGATFTAALQLRVLPSFEPAEELA